jgi:hypothetical protein
MAMLGLTLLSRTIVYMKLNKWSPRVCGAGFLVTQALCNRKFLGGTLVRANEFVICSQSNKQDN